MWFYQTALCIALHVGDVLTARMLAYDVGVMIDHQIMRDGTLPLELERPRKIHYTCYAMTAFFRCGWAAVRKYILRQRTLLQGAHPHVYIHVWCAYTNTRVHLGLRA